MQNATDLAKHPIVTPSEEETLNFDDLEANDDFVAQMTTTYLQKNQTDFHILPTCSATKCTASGTFINDDGVTTDVTQRNTYAFTYEHDVVTTTPVSPVSMTVTIKTSGVMTMINANDLLNKIEIYDATRFGMDLATGATYSVVVNFFDTKKAAQDLGTAAWSCFGDKLEILAPNHFVDAAVPVDLTQVDTIVFTKK